MGLSSALGGAVGILPAGAVIPYAGSAAPAGWLMCGGQEVSRTDFAALFAVVGTTYGSGNGTTTFNIPDLRGRVIAGEDDMGGTAANRLTAGGSGITGATLGASGGAETVTLTSAQSGVSAHQHANTATFTGTAVNTGNQSVDHTHSGTTGNDSPDHTHQTYINTSNINTRTAGTAGYNVDTGGTWNTFGASTRHQHGFTTGGVSANHTHSVTASGTVAVTNVNNTAANAASAHTNTQPTIILNYIIKAVAY